MIGWVNNWNTIIRKIIWPDHELKVLMKIPPKTGILQFNQRYFIRAGFTNELLTDEVCRIIYSDSEKAATYYKGKYYFRSLDDWSITSEVPAKEIKKGGAYTFDSCGDYIFVFNTETGELLNRISVK